MSNEELDRELEAAKTRFYTRKVKYAEQDQIELALRIIKLVREESKDAG